jgi:hypothetical protein
MPACPVAPEPLIFGRRSSAAFLRDQRVEKMLDVDGLITETHRFLLRGADRGRRLFGKLV